jgi:hypothetical protein
MSFRLAVRALARSKLLTSLVVVAIALAVAVNTALFSILDGLLVRPLPFPNPDQLIALSWPMTGGRPPEIAYLPERSADRDALRERLDTSALIAGTTQVGFKQFFMAWAP